MAVTARTENVNLGTAIRTIKAKLNEKLPENERKGFTLEFGGLYEQQQAEFRNLLFVLVMAALLIFLVLLVEFRSFLRRWRFSGVRFYRSSAWPSPCGSPALP